MLVAAFVLPGALAGSSSSEASPKHEKVVAVPAPGQRIELRAYRCTIQCDAHPLQMSTRLRVAVGR